MTARSHTELLEHFLGTGAASAGPFSLLGISARDATPARIEAALQNRLDQVDQHRHAFTPEADEVRLELHTAAAQLLDPAVRAELLRKTVGEQPPEHRPHIEPLSTDERVDFELSTTVQPPVTPASSPGVAAPPTPYNAPSWRDYPATIDPHEAGKQRTERTAIFVLAIAGMLLVGVVLAVAILSSRTPQGTQTTTAPTTNTLPYSPVSDVSIAEPKPSSAQSQSRTASPPELQTGASSLARTQFREPSVVIRAMRQLADDARRDPRSASTSVAGTLAPFADWWCEYDVGNRIAGIDASVEIFYALASSSDSAESSIAVLHQWSQPASVAGVAPPASSPHPWRSAFAVGLLMRLSNQAELPRPAVARVRDALNTTLGTGRSVEFGTFDRGATLALRLLARRLSDPTSTENVNTSTVAKARVTDLVIATRATTGDDPIATERLLVEALEYQLTNAPEPDQSLMVHAVIGELVGTIKWRTDGPARARLLEWFRSSAVSIADLNVATTALVTRSSAQGVEGTMILSIGATRDDRVRVRTLIAQAWGMSDAELREQASSEFVTIARELIARTSDGTDLGTLASAAEAARLCDGARMIWLGDPAGAMPMLRDTAQIVEAASRLARTDTDPATRTTNSPTDAQWAMGYLQAERNIPLRIERLAQLANVSRPIGKVDAAVLVEQACYGSPASVRSTAQQWVRKLSQDPAVIEAMLDRLPTLPRTTQLSELIESVALTRLPKASHPRWEFTARRELVSRLLDSLAEQSATTGVDALAGIIAAAYDGQPAQGQPTTPTAANAARLDAPTRVLDAVRRSWEFWHAEAVPLAGSPAAPARLGEVERRRRSRLAVASSLLQEFAAEQTSLAELMCIVVAGERPQDAAQVREIFDQLTRERQQARHVFEQIKASEHAMLKLWIIRLGTTEGA